MEFDNSFDMLTCGANTFSLSDRLEQYRTFKETHSKVKKHLTGADEYRLFRELTSNKVSCLYRKRDDASDAIVSLWISRVKHIASLFIATNSLKSFEGLSKDELIELAQMSHDEKAILKLESILMAKGIILVLEPSIAGLKLDGCVYINETGHAIVALSLRFNRLDNFWFTLMHELAHLVLHADKLETPILEDLEEKPSDLVEQQADMLAGKSFIPRSEWRTCKAKISFDERDVLDFAQRLNIHPSIVAGRIRRESGHYEKLSKLVNKHDVRRILGV